MLNYSCMKRLVLVLLLIILTASPSYSRIFGRSDEQEAESTSVIIQEVVDEEDKPVNDEQVDSQDLEVSAEEDPITLESKKREDNQEPYPILFKMYAEKADFDEKQSPDYVYNLNNGGKLKLEFKKNSKIYFEDKDRLFKSVDIDYDTNLKNKLNLNVNIQARNNNGFDSQTTARLFSYIYKDINANRRLYFGQAMLSDSAISNLSFIEQQEYRSNVGAKIAGRGKYFDYEAGLYKSPETNSIASGLVASSKSISLIPNAGSVRFGSGYYAQGRDENALNTYGVFGEYKYNKFKIKSEYARNKYQYTDNVSDNIFIIPELSLTKNLSIKTKYSKEVASENYINDFIIDYSLQGKNNWKVNNIKLEFDASYIRQADTDYYQRFKFVTKYNF